jgi:hypothetical protein
MREMSEGEKSKRGAPCLFVFEGLKERENN